MKVTLINLGCPKNQKDGEVALSSFLENGFSYTKNIKTADVIIVNTCSFIDDAKKESISVIFECAEYKTKGKCSALIVTGCFPQRYKKEIKKELPEVDIFLGVSTYARAYESFKKFEKSKKKIVRVDKPGYIHSDVTHLKLLHSKGYTPETFNYSAYVKVSEGCNNKCAYCTIPSIRGKLVYKTGGAVIDEIKYLTSAGVKEIVLIAQDIAADKNYLKTLLKNISALPQKTRPAWVRLMYCNPWGVDSELIKIIKNEEWIVNYIDMPIQHISDDVLKRMGRHSNSSHILDTLEKLKVAKIVVRSTLMTGFPGEGEKDFKALRDLVSQGWFHWLGLFVYSPQENTPAALMKPRVPFEIGLERRNELDRIQFDITNSFNEGYVGKTFQALVCGRCGKDTEARIFSQAPVVDGEVIIKGDVKGSFVDVTIDEANGYDLVGRIISPRRR
ncbi:MAG: 30S ribosomal protein S12 methylthiotransferase RimO [Pseudomonadota bacterium]